MELVGVISRKSWDEVGGEYEGAGGGRFCDTCWKEFWECSDVREREQILKG